MAGTNDSTMKSSELILVELLQLKTFIEKQLPGCTVIISCPTDRSDDHKAKLANLHMRRKLNNLKLPIIVNDNITEVHIGKKGSSFEWTGFGQASSEFSVLHATTLATNQLGQRFAYYQLKNAPHVSHVSYTEFMGVSNFEKNGLHGLSPFALAFHPKRAAIALNTNALPFSPKKSCPLRDGLINLNRCSQPSSPRLKW